MPEFRRPVSRRQFVRGAASATASLSALQFLAACGENGGEDAPAGTIRYIKGPHIDNDAEIQASLASEFEREFAEVRVRPEFYDWDTNDADLTAAYASGNPPDVAYIVTATWPKFAESGALVDLSDRVRESAFQSTYDATPEQLWSSITLDDQVWGVPLLGATFPVYINKTLLDRAGVLDSWRDSLESMHDAAAKCRGGNVFGFSIAQTVAEEAYDDLNPYLHNNGADLVNEAGTEAALSTPEAAAALDLLQRLHVDGIAPEPGLYDGEGKVGLFKAGRIAIAHNTPFLAAELVDSPPDFEWDVALIPAGPAGETAGGDYGYLCIAAASENPDAAWEYVKFLSSANQVVSYLDSIGKTLQAARTDVASKLFGEGSSPQKKMQEEFAPVTVPYRTFPQQPQARRILIEQYERCIRGQQSGEETLAACDEQIDQLLA